ncbi:hypothetical protein SAMN06295909_1811 [Plantibacter sp. VKM Ac-1784]|uniref:Uncharacterized protein n=1 Tax=Plantibacter elymi (nom. nud.) TaxID=199708 RepID=A0ABY1RCJ6_9MICO|nr:hypothetical protein [Plantibacter sp. VKM Ac-1784]SMQ67681.1 hypothetical protein SAMN06295909_1811 [Plantibacter sp. VKM Ac-1784]
MDMRYVDHEPGMWFLVEQERSLYLDARYSYSVLIDDSALIRLNDTELAAYLAGDHDALSDLAGRVHNSAPYRSESPFFSRDLYRTADGTQYREAVSAAIADHTWITEQRRKR